jgi:hypothetical protein
MSFIFSCLLFCPSLPIGLLRIEAELLLIQINKLFRIIYKCRAAGTPQGMQTGERSIKAREETIMHITNYSIGIVAATVLGICVVAPVNASPVLTNTAALKSATDNTITEVRYIRRGWARAAVATGVGLAVAGAVASYAYGYPYSYGYPSYSYGYSSGYAPYGYNNYGYSGYSYSPGYYGYGARRVVRGVARRAYYRR